MQPASHPGACITYLLTLAHRHDIWMLSDDVYQLLYFRDRPPPVMPYLTPKALSFGSFSKIVAPGLRLGWIQADPEVIITLALRGYIVRCVHACAPCGSFVRIDSHAYPLQRRRSESLYRVHHIPSS